MGTGKARVNRDSATEAIRMSVAPHPSSLRMQKDILPRE